MKLEMEIFLLHTVWERMGIWGLRVAAAWEELRVAVLRMAADCGVRVGVEKEERRRCVFMKGVREYDGMIRRICLGYSRSAEDLEDLYQDVLVNIWQGLAGYRADASMKTWIYRVALNTCVSSLRRRSSRPNAASLEDVVNVSDDSGEKMQEVRELHECISMLGNIDKAVVMLWLDEYSYEEIAGLTGLTRGNVATRLHRAKEKLKNIYGNGR